jgi:hypothetical protein
MPGGTDPTFQIDESLPSPVVSRNTPSLPVNTSKNLFIYYNTGGNGNQNLIGLDLSSLQNYTNVRIFVDSIGAVHNNTLNDTTRTFLHTVTWTNTSHTFDFGASGNITQTYFDLYVDETIIYVSRLQI